MKIKPRWLCFTAVAVTQVALLMVGLQLLFGWMDFSRVETLKSQVLDNAMATAINTGNRLQSQSLRRFRNQDGTPDGAELAIVQNILGDVTVSNQGFTCLLDAESGDTICESGTPEAIQSICLGKQVFADVAMGAGDPTTLTEVFANSSARSRKVAKGDLVIGDKHWWTAVRFVPQLNAILVVAHPRDVALSYSNQLVGSAQLRIVPLAGAFCLFAIFAQLIASAWFEEKLLNINTGLERQVTNNERELVRTRNAVIFGLAKLAESRDNDTGEHLERIRQYVEILCDDLVHIMDGIEPDMLHDISLASSLHDIGKVGIPDSILLKPGRLTPEERDVMQIHTLIGGECLDAIHARLGENKFMDIARQIAYYHHERWDGNGYPHGLSSDEIPIVARIVAVADVYDALTSKRPYKRAMGHFESKTIVVSGSGTQFDPEVVAAFLRHEDKFEAISLRQQALSDEEATSKFALLHGLVAAGQSE